MSRLSHLPRRARRALVVVTAVMVMFTGVSASALLAPSPAGASSPAGANNANVRGTAPLTSGGWGNAEEVPGSATLNVGGEASVASVSCASAGDCSAGGSYYTGSAAEVFVVNQTSGTWGNAEEVPGTPTLNAGGGAQILSLSCGSAGNCSAGGYYTDSSSAPQAFVVNETNGTWGAAQEVPGTATLDVGALAQLSSVSCPAAGDCSAGGYYTDNFSAHQAFVVKETNGTWGNAEEVPGTPTLNAGGEAHLNSVSCASTGDCSGGGNYTDSSGNVQAFVVNETNGTWGGAEEVPGSATLDGVGGNATVASVSCGSAGNCSAGGVYASSSNAREAFVVNETNGTWGTAEKVPGTGTLNADDDAQVSTVSCAAAGDCSAGGDYVDSSSNSQVFVANETNGTWASAEEVPGTSTLNADGDDSLLSLSCAPAGDCSAGGYYQSLSDAREAFVVTEANGTWANAEEVPGTGTLNAVGDAQISTVSCAAAGECSAGGFYIDSAAHMQAFVVSSAGAAAPTITSFAPTSGPVGTKVTIKGTNLTGATKVTFNGTAATITSDTATKIVVHVPNSATTGKIKVKTPNGSVKSATRFTVT